MCNASGVHGPHCNDFDAGDARWGIQRRVPIGRREKREACAEVEMEVPILTRVELFLGLRALYLS